MRGLFFAFLLGHAAVHTVIWLVGMAISAGLLMYALQAQT